MLRASMRAPTSPQTALSFLHGDRRRDVAAIPVNPRDCRAQRFHLTGRRIEDERTGRRKESPAATRIPALHPLCISFVRHGCVTTHSRACSIQGDPGDDAQTTTATNRADTMIVRRLLSALLNVGPGRQLPGPGGDLRRGLPGDAGDDGRLRPACGAGSSHCSCGRWWCTYRCGSCWKQSTLWPRHSARS